MALSGPGRRAGRCRVRAPAAGRRRSGFGVWSCGRRGEMRRAPESSRRSTFRPASVSQPRSSSTVPPAPKTPAHAQEADRQILTQSSAAYHRVADQPTARLDAAGISRTAAAGSGRQCKPLKDTHRSNRCPRTASARCRPRRTRCCRAPSAAARRERERACRWRGRRRRSAGSGRAAGRAAPPRRRTGHREPRTRPEARRPCGLFVEHAGVGAPQHESGGPGEPFVFDAKS